MKSLSSVSEMRIILCPTSAPGLYTVTILEKKSSLFHLILQHVITLCMTSSFFSVIVPCPILLHLQGCRQQSFCKSYGSSRCLSHTSVFWPDPPSIRCGFELPAVAAKSAVQWHLVGTRNSLWIRILLKSSFWHDSLQTVVRHGAHRHCVLVRTFALT